MNLFCGETWSPFQMCFDEKKNSKIDVRYQCLSSLSAYVSISSNFKIIENFQSVSTLSKKGCEILMMLKNYTLCTDAIKNDSSQSI